MSDSVITDISWERVHLSLTATLDLEAVLAAAARAAEERAAEQSVSDDDLVAYSESAGLVVNSDMDDPAAVQTDTAAAAGERGTDAEAAAIAAAEPDIDEMAAHAPGEPDVVFKIISGKRQLSVPTTRVDDGVYRLDVNVINFRSRRHVPDGTWRIVPFVDGHTGGPAGFDVNAADTLAEASRTFLYDNNRVSYIISLGLSEDDDPALLLRTYQMFRRVKTAKKKRTIKNVQARTRAKLLPNARRIRLANLYYRLARRANPPKGNRVLFASEARPSMGGNLLRIRDRMVERGLDEQFEFRYSFRVPSMFDRWGTLRVIYLIATSDIVIIDDYFGLLEPLKINKATTIIQAWHAGSGFKAIGYSRFGNYGSPKLSNAHRKYTYALTGSKHLVHVYAEAFGIEESAVIPTGLPRIDTFLDPARTETMKAKFYRDNPKLVGKKIILFAPTFRGRGNQNAFYDYDRIDFAQLYEVCGEDTVVLFRMHHFIAEPVPIPPEYADRLVDFTHFPDTNDLLHMTDILITDYSSIIYEFALLNRPMLFFAYDKENYAATRGFHRDYDQTAPGKVCETFDELCKALRTEDYDTWKIGEFRTENFDEIDTHSADRVIDWLILGTPPGHEPRPAIPSPTRPSADGGPPRQQSTEPAGGIPMNPRPSTIQARA